MEFFRIVNKIALLHKISLLLFYSRRLHNVSLICASMVLLCDIYDKLKLYLNIFPGRCVATTQFKIGNFMASFPLVFM